MKELFGQIAALKWYVLFSAALFLAGIWTGATSLLLADQMENQVRSLSTVAQTLYSMPYRTFWLGAFIFINNTFVAILSVYFGAILGLFPLLVLFVNGAIVGYLLRVVDVEVISVGDLILRGLLPHGIVELPAILIACSFGLRFGVAVLQKLGGLQKRNGEVMRLFRLSFSLILFVAVLLLIAAIIEVTVTDMLLN